MNILSCINPLEFPTFSNNTLKRSILYEEKKLHNT